MFDEDEEYMCFELEEPTEADPFEIVAAKEEELGEPIAFT